MYSSVNIERILFVDIETVPQSAGYECLDDNMRRLWDKKAASIARYDNSVDNCVPADLYERAGIYSEFGKVVCYCCFAESLPPPHSLSFSEGIGEMRWPFCP